MINSSKQLVLIMENNNRSNACLMNSGGGGGGAKKKMLHWQREIVRWSTLQKRRKFRAYGFIFFMYNVYVCVAGREEGRERKRC